MSALPPKADIDRACWDVCFVPKAGIHRPYSITSSAATCRVCGNVMPSVFGSFEVEDQLNFYGLLDRQVTRLFPLEYAANIAPNCAVLIGKV
jgi:hypothetical protein